LLAEQFAEATLLEGLEAVIQLGKLWQNRRLQLNDRFASSELADEA